MEIRLVLNGLDCANCANKIETKVNKINGIKEATVNFSTTLLIAEIKEESLKDEIINEIKSIVKKLEPDVKVEEKLNNTVIKNTTSECKDSCCSTSFENGEVKKCTEKTKINKNETHNHTHSNGLSENNAGVIEYIKENIMLIIGTLIYLVALAYNGNNNSVSIILFIASYLVIGGEVILTALKNITNGEIFDENFLMSIATIGAFFIGEYPEAVAVMLFYQIGEVFQGYAVNKSRKSISSLMNIRADYANVLRSNNEVKVSPEDVSLNEVILIKPGERVPLDGVVLSGESFLDTSALTGESVPREIKAGDEILSGEINNSGVLKVRVTKEYGESTVARILELVENASNKKAPTEKFITKFSKIYTPIVVLVAVLVAIIPPIFIKGAVFSEWLYKALSLLVVSCPCALVVSIPLGFFSGIGAASKKGVLVKGGNYLEALKESEIIVFDKTGTLTKGVFKVTSINAKNISKDELLEIFERLCQMPRFTLSIIKEFGNFILLNKEVAERLFNHFERLNPDQLENNIVISYLKSLYQNNHEQYIDACEDILRFVMNDVLTFANHDLQKEIGNRILEIEGYDLLIDLFSKDYNTFLFVCFPISTFPPEYKEIMRLELEKAIRFYAARMNHDEYRLTSFEQVANINRLLMEEYKEEYSDGKE